MNYINLLSERRRLMKIKYLLFASVAFAGFTLSAKDMNPITKAMLDGYESLLKENPDDYMTLYERASQYYRLDDYDKALSDIKRAVACTPAGDKGQLASEYSLLTDIYIQTGQYPEALMSVDKALALTPDSYSLLYMKGNVCLHLNQPEAAKESFSAMQRLNSRSQEAIFGLARVAAMEGRKDVVLKYIEDAAKMAPSDYLTYCRVGDLHRELDMPQDAAGDYLSAFSLTDKSDRPLSSLISLAKENYAAVDNAIDYAIGRTPNVVPLYFLQGNAALAAGQYEDAYNAYRQLLASVTESDANSLNASMAKICLHRGDIVEADVYASKAMSANPDDLQTYLVKADIERVRGNYPSARMYADAALRLEPNSGDALKSAALAAYGSGDYNMAITLLNEAVMNNAEDADALLLRGYVQETFLGNKTAALADFSRVASLNTETNDEIARKAMAQLKAGMSLDASATIAPVNVSAGTNGRDAYLMALYNLASDNEAEAQKMLKQAVDLGFNDHYLLDFYDFPLYSVRGLLK